MKDIFNTVHYTVMKYTAQWALLCLCIFSQSAQSQNCIENLLSANKNLEAGKLVECIQLAKLCTHESNDPSSRAQAFRLLSITWLQQNQADSAKWAAEQMLNINPMYKPNLLKDPAEFIAVLKNIVVIPKFSLGLAFSAGTNSTFPSIGDGYVVGDYEKKYQGKSGTQFGTWLGFNISPSFKIETGILATTKVYNIKYAPVNWSVNIKEQLSYVDLPIAIKYSRNIYHRLSANASMGAFTGYLLYANNTFSSNYLPDEKKFELTNLNIKERRHKYNSGLMGGIGLNYKLRQGQIGFQANYYQSFTKINITSQRWNFQEQIYTYFYVDDDITLSNLTLSIGYTYFLNYKVYRLK